MDALVELADVLVGLAFTIGAAPGAI